MLTRILDLRAATGGGGAGRLVDRCLELWFQEAAANDERHTPTAPMTAEAFVEALLEV